MTRTVLLGDLVDVVKGISYRSADYSDSENGLAFVTLKSVERGGGYNKNGIKYYAGELKDSQYVEPGDILIANTDLTQNREIIGSPLIMPDIGRKACFSLDLSKLVIKDEKQLDKDYLFYYLKSPHARDYMISHSNGSTVMHLSVKSVPKMPMRLPEISEQRRIGKVLREIDEKIELNRQMNETLEQMGQALFRHYFIDNPEAEGWRKSKLGELTDINRESIGKDYPHDKIQYVDIASVSTGSIDKYETIELSSAPSRARRIVRDSDIIWATVRPNRRAYSLVMNPAENMIVSTGFAVMSPGINALGFVYYYTSLQAFADYLVLHARGAAYPAVTAADFKGAPIKLPDNKALELFDELVAPNLQRISELKKEIQILVTLRDTLLPRLISGKVKV